MEWEGWKKVRRKIKIESKVSYEIFVGKQIELTFWFSQIYYH